MRSVGGAYRWDLSAGDRVIDAVPTGVMDRIVAKQFAAAREAWGNNPSTVTDAQMSARAELAAAQWLAGLEEMRLV